jgi:hypothetical protein
MQRLRHVLRAVGAVPTAGCVEVDALEQIEPRLRGIYEQRDFGENPVFINVPARACVSKASLDARLHEVVD